MSTCSHLDQIQITNTSTHVCKECTERGDTWVHLRLCLECGHVGCCNDSKNKHATKHFHHTDIHSSVPSSPENPGSGVTRTIFLPAK
jgi:hypothetical protein